MKKGLIFSLMIAFLLWAISSWAWYPDQEKDGIKDDKSPEEVKKLIEQGQFGTRADYEPKPGYPWKVDLEKGTVTGDQLNWLQFDNRDHWGFYSRSYWRSSLYLNARGYYGGSSGNAYRYFHFNEGQPKWEDNFGDTLSYHEGKLKEGDLYSSLMHLFYWPSLEVGNNMMNHYYIKTPKLYKEQDIWRYFANRRKVIRLSASDKAESIAGGPVTYDDIGSRTPWEYESKIIGTDVIKPEDYFFTKQDIVEKMEPPIKDVMKPPFECWVVEAKARDKGYYLGKIIYWIAKGKNRGEVVPIREEQYDRQMNLWRIRENLWSNPHEDGDRSNIWWDVWDLRLDFRDAVYFNDGFAPVHNLPIPGGFEKKRFFSLETLKSEWRWFDIASERLRKKNWQTWRSTTPPALMRDKFPEHRKIVLRKEVEEKVKKLVEKGIFE